MKSCFKCGVEKPLSEYYKHPQMKDGHLNKCKDCTKEAVKQNRVSKEGYYKNYDRNRPNHRSRAKAGNERKKVKYKSNQGFRESVLKCNRKWIENNPKKRMAQNAANNAVRDGKIVRKTSCEHCNNKVKLQKHHWSYEEEYWLDVVWLCPPCHGKEHKRLNDLGRDPDRD